MPDASANPAPDNEVPTASSPDSHGSEVDGGGTPGGDGPPAGDVAGVRAALETALKERAAAMDELKTRDARIGDLEAAVKKAADDAAAGARSAETIKAMHARAVQKYTALVIAANPEVPAELVSGATVEAVEESLARAKSLVAKVRESLASQAAAAATSTRVPAGAPARTGPDPDGLSPREKIQLGLRKK